MFDCVYDFGCDVFQLVVEVFVCLVLVMVFDVLYVWNDWMCMFFFGVDEVVIMVVLDFVNLCNVKNMFDVLKKFCLNDKLFYLIINQVGMLKCLEILSVDFVDFLGVQLIVVIFFEVQFFGNVVNSGCMIVEIDFKVLVVEIFLQIVYVVMGCIIVKCQKGSSFVKMFVLFNCVKSKV